jgi:hypothetical protein
MEESKNRNDAVGNKEILMNDNISKNSIMFLDVATHYTGMAVYTKGKITPPIYELTGYGNITATHSEEWEDRCLELSSKISGMIHKIKPGCLVIEYPTFQGGAKGAAASRSGGTLELAFLCGRIAVCWEYFVAKVMRDTKEFLPMVQLVPYYKWAGQTNKAITCKRLKENLNIEADPSSVDNNWADAIMMGRWYITDQLGLPVCNNDAKKVEV